ncbi:MAG TPA: DUF5107 domain-containing protein [Microlunatus sp.]
MSALELSTLTLPTARVGTSPLPPLRSTADLHTVAADDSDSVDSIDEEMSANLAYGHRPSVLPYLLQDDYDRILVDVAHPTAVLSNDRLRATFLLGQGGRLWSLVDLVTGRELLYANAALQPGNLALRNAWFAGGVEWNLGTTGHHPLTCEPLHAARITLPDGSAGLRLWEYERMRELVLQIDAWLPDGAPHLAVHITITNVTAHDVPAYWWSNIAVPETPATRVLTPADAAYRFDYSRTLRRVRMPVDDGVDRSYPSRSSHAVDYFFDLPSATPRPWIAAVDADGYGLLQTSSPRLRGRKLFVWGAGPGGRHWQDWLSPCGGCYLEIQAGLARTQLEHLPLPANERWSWLETYGPLQLSAGSAHGDWATAVATANDLLDPDHGWFAEQVSLGLDLVDGPIEDRLQRASGWGALEVRRRAGTSDEWPDLTGTPFPEEDLGAEQQPWLALLEGRRSAWDGTPPTSYQTAAGWRSLLEYAAGPYAALQRGVARWAGGDRLGAVDAWEQSLRDQPSAVGWRNVAVAYAGDDHARALAGYREARTLDPTLIAVVIEHLELLIMVGHHDVVLAEIDALPAVQRTVPMIMLCEARAAVAVGDADRAGRVLVPDVIIPTLREGAETIGRLWRDYRALVAGRATAEAEDLPTAYDFSMRPS